MSDFTDNANLYYCPVCAAEIYLHPEMSSGYCKKCGEKVTLRMAMNCEMSAEALERLSKAELYSLKKRFGVYPSIVALKALAAKGSIPANTLLSLYYYEQKDYSAMVDYANEAAVDENWDGYFYYAVGMYKTGQCDIIESIYKIMDGAIEGGFELDETREYCDGEFRVIKNLYEKELEKERRSYSSSYDSGYNSSYSGSSYGSSYTPSSISDKDYDDFLFMNKQIERMYTEPNWGDDASPYVHDPESFPLSSEIW